MKRAYLAVALPMALALAGCSSAPKPAPKAAETAKPAEPVSGLSAIYKMYMQARAWSPDVKLLRVGNLSIKELKNAGGKAGAWEAVFVSEGNRQSRRFTYSVVESPSSNLHQGVFGGSADSWTPGRLSSPFYIQMAKADSDAALEEAMTKAAEYSKKHPELPVNFVLEQTKRFRDPAWRVIWGESVSTSNFSIFVDANTGKYLQTAH